MTLSLPKRPLIIATLTLAATAGTKAQTNIDLTISSTSSTDLCKESEIDFIGPAKQVDVLIQPQSVNTTIFRIDSPSTAIKEIPAENPRRADDFIYNLRRERITKATKGIYIQNGKKYIAR